jgi:hypothetical protein
VVEEEEQEEEGDDGDNDDDDAGWGSLQGAASTEKEERGVTAGDVPTPVSLAS